MFNKLLGDFINGAISAHTSHIRNQDVSLKLMQNSINITELELYQFALFQYGFPIVIKCGFIKNIEVIVPWATFQTDEVKITIDNIFILASLPNENPTDFVSEKDLYDIREHQLAAHHEFSKKFYNILKIISQQKLSQIAKRVLHSCSIEIKNLHIRIEIENQNKYHAFGIITSSINIFTHKKSKGIPPIIEKNINFQNFSVYLDLDQPKVDYNSVDEFIIKMKNLATLENHQFLLDPSSISAKLKSSTEEESSNIEILMDFNDITLSISKQQLPIILKITSNIKKFNQFMFINKCKLFTKKYFGEKISSDDNNDEFDPFVNWIFFHNLAKEKNNSSLDSILDRILYRNKYVKEWNKLVKKSNRTPSIINLDHKLDFQAVLFFRSFADSTKINLLKIDYDEILRFANYDPLIFITSFASRFLINASINELKINLLNENDKFLCQILITNPSLQYRYQHLHFGLESFNIFIKENEKKFDIFKSISPLKNIISLDATFQNLTNCSFKILSEPMNFRIDLIRLINLFSNLDLNISQETIEQMKIEQINYNILVSLKEIHFLIFILNNELFDFGLKSLEIHQNQSNIKEYLFSIKNASFSHGNNYIIDNLNILSSAFHGIMNITIPYFTINLMKNDFIKLDELKLSSLISKKVPFSMKNVKIELEGIDVHSDILQNAIILQKTEITYLNNLYKSEVDISLSRIEIGYLVIEKIIFKLFKELNSIQSTISIDQFYIKELEIQIKAKIPFIKGIYNHAEETMNIDLGINSIEFKDNKSIQNIQSLLYDLISLTKTIDDEYNINDIEENEKSFIKYIFNLFGKKEVKLPQINFAIHFTSLPISIIYNNNLSFDISLEWIILFNPFMFNLSVPSLKIRYSNDKYFEMKNFTLIFMGKIEINISILQIDLNVTEKLIQKTKNLFQNMAHLINPNIKSLFLTKEIPNIKINLPKILLKFLKISNKYSIKIPLSQFSITINKEKNIYIQTNAMIKCSEIGINTDLINLSVAYKSKKENEAIEMQIRNNIQINFFPITFQKFIAVKNIFYVNQTGIELTIIVDDKKFTIPNNSSYITSHFPNDTKICFVNGTSNTFLDISRLWGEQSILTSFDSGMILVWRSQSTLVFSSPIEILNTTGYSIQLLDDYFNKTILPNNQNFFVPPNIESKVKTLSISILDTNLKIKAKLLDKSYTIQNDDLFFRFIVERNSTSLVARVTITAIIFIRSYFTEPLLAEFSHKSDFKKFILYPSVKVPINIYDINTKKITFKLSSFNKNGYFNVCTYIVNISLVPGESTITLADAQHSKETFYLRYKVSEDNNMIKIIDIYAIITVVNQLGFSILLSQNEYNKKALLDFNSQNKPAIHSMFCPSPHPPVFKYKKNPHCYIKDDNISFFLSYPLTLKFTKEKFAVSKIDTKELVLLPTSQNDDKIMPVTFQVKHDEAYTSTIVLKPYVILFNNTNKPIRVDGKVIDMYNYLIVKSVSSSLNIIINTNGLDIPINLENISNFSISGPSLHFKIQFTISFIDDIKYITISKDDSLGSFAVINETDIDFIINQVDMKMSQYFALSQSSILFDLSDTRTECSIECFAKNIPPFIIQLDHPKDITSIPGNSDDSLQLFYSVEIVGNNRHVAHLYQKSPSIKNEINPSMNFLMNIPSISIKIIGKEYQEYCNVTFGTISFHILHQEMKESIALSIENIQIDDMNEFSEHPVILYSLKKPFFNLGLFKTINSSFYEYLICTITPIACKIDISFIIDIINLFNFQNIKNEKQSNQNDYISSNFRCLLLKFSQIDANVSIFNHTSRQSNRFEKNASIPRIISFIPSIENFHIQLSPINAVDMCCSQKEFFLVIFDNAQLSISKYWLHLIGSTVIKNPQKMISKFSSAFKKPTNKLIKEDQFVNQNISSSSSFSKTAKIDIDSNNESQTKSGGLKSFFSGIVKTKRGVLSNPNKLDDRNSTEFFDTRRNSIKFPKRIEEPKYKNHSSLKSLDIIIFFSYEANISEDFVFIDDVQIEINDISWVKKGDLSKIVTIETKNDQKQFSIEFEKEKIANKFYSVLQLQIERKLTQKIFMIPYSL